MGRDHRNLLKDPEDIAYTKNKFCSSTQWSLKLQWIELILAKTRIIFYLFRKPEYYHIRNHIPLPGKVKITF